MGCCASTSADPAHYDQQGNSSSRAINAAQPQPHAGIQRPSTHASSHSNRLQHAQPLSAVVNQPIKHHEFTTKRLWTRAELDRERVEFFDTRVSNRPEMWQAIRAAIEILWAEAGPESQDGGIATAQQILDAAGLTVPTGYLHRGIYDSLGSHYLVPDYIISDPSNLVDTPPRVDGAGGDERSGKSSSELDEEELLRRREEKGKAVISPMDMISVRARLSDTSGDLKVSISKNDSVRLVSQRILEEAGHSPPHHIKIAYLGKILDEKQSLMAQGWQEGHVLNALVFN